MMTTNPFLRFVTEMILRLKSKNPKFFNILILVVSIIGLIPWIPDAINLLGFDIPEIFNDPKTKKWLSICSAIGIFFMQFSSQSTEVAKTADGTVLKVTDAKKLPFTASVEAKKAEKKSVPTVSTPELDNLKK